MLKRSLLSVLLLVVSTTTATAQSPPVPDVRCDCCAKKPRYTDAAYSTFTGQIAIATQEEDPSSTSQWKNRVVMIWDLANHSNAPLDTRWYSGSAPPTQAYSHASWTVGNLGEVFGITLDDTGNVFVAATRIYGNNNVGSLSTVAGNAAAGQIYILQNGSGNAAPFVNLKQGPAGEGLGNLSYDCVHDSLYATNFHDGLIYRITPDKVIQPKQWDHGANLPTAVNWNGAPLVPVRQAILGFDGSSSYAALGRRPWAVRVYKNRLYYGIWSQNWGTDATSTTVPKAIISEGTAANEVWSVPLDANGDPYGPARLEIIVPQFNPITSPRSNPISDIAFGPMGTMLIAERTMIAKNSSYAHASRVLEYSWNGNQWVLPNPSAYSVGLFPTNGAGGVDFDFSPGGRVWATSDAMHYAAKDRLYGIQGLPAGGGSHFNSVLIDLNDDVDAYNKAQIGDVRIPCPDCTNSPTLPVIKGPETMCVSPAHYSVAPQSGITYSWTVSGGTPATGSGPSIDVNWSSNTGGTVTVTATATGAGACGPVATSFKVVPCKISCDFCNEYKTAVTLAPPATISGGLKSVVPTVTSAMPGVNSVTVTLLNASVAYSSGSCGTSGPLAAYIPLASSSSVAALNPPILPVPNGNQAIWRSSAAVNLSGGATTPFQLQLPAPPFFPFPPCNATYSFCLRVSLGDDKCRSCDVIRCFGPFAYSEWINIIDDHDIQTIIARPILGGFFVPLVALLEGSESLTSPGVFPLDAVSFEPGGAALAGSSTSTLDGLAAVLSSHPSVEIRLDAYAEERGDPAANRRIALERATALRDRLLRAGVAPNRVAVESKSAVAGRPANTPIDLVVVKK